MDTKQIVVLTTSAQVASAKTKGNTLFGYSQDSIMRASLSPSGSGPATHHICTMKATDSQIADINSNIVIADTKVFEGSSIRKILRDNGLRMIRT